jgi:hypothetical protein
VSSGHPITIEIGLAPGYLAPRIDFNIKVSSRNRMPGFGSNYSAPVRKARPVPGRKDRPLAHPVGEEDSQMRLTVLNAYRV